MWETAAETRTFMLGGMNRKRITLTLVVLLTPFVLWRAAPVLYLLYPAGIVLACCADGYGS